MLEGPGLPLGTQALVKCPECRVELRADRLSRHLRRVHVKDEARGEVRIDDLAQELGVKRTLIVRYLREWIYPSRLKSNVVGSVLAEVLREDFRSRPARGYYGTTNPQSRVQQHQYFIPAPEPGKRSRPSPDPDRLFRDLEALAGRAYPPKAEVPRHEQVMAKRLQKPADLAVERFPFRLLPPGNWDLEYVIAYYRGEAARFPAGSRDRGIDPTRLEAIMSLKPARCYVGEEQWLGYVVFEFLGSDRVVLECPVRGNATYVLWGDWKSMVAHTKRYLWTHFPRNYLRITHAGRWLKRTRRALRLR